MSYSGFNVPKKEDNNIVSSRKKYKVSIIVSEWNNKLHLNF